MNEEERLDAISAALAGMVESQRALTARMERIEVALHLTTAPVVMALREVTPPPLPPPLPVEVRADEANLETRFGLGWLNRVAAITLLLGVGFLFKYAVDNEWIGPGARVALGLAAATLALAAGEWMTLRGQKIFAQGVTGLGLALLYLSFYASFALYHLLAQSVAFGLMFVTTVGAGALAKHYESQAVAVLGLVGGLLTPGLLATGENQLGMLAVYTVVLNAGALAMGRLKRWRALEAIAFAGTWMLFAGWSASYLGDQTRGGAFAWLTASFLVFFLASVFSERMWLLAVNAGFYFAASYYVLDPQFHARLGAFAAALAALHGAAFVMTRHKDARFAQLAAAIGAVFFTVAIPLQFTGFRITMLWACEAAALAWLAKRWQTPRLQAGAWALFATVGVRLLWLDGLRREAQFSNRRLLTFAIVAASLWIAARFALSQRARSIAYGVGHIVLWWAIELELDAWILRTAERRDAANFSSAAMSIWMAVYAAGLIAAGVALRSSMNRILGLGFMALVIAKLYLFDVWELSRGLRITAFLVLGGLLLVVSYLYSRFRPALERIWKTQPSGADASL